jgi:opacity protein-like surface antigen
MGTWSRTLFAACALIAGPITGAVAADFRFPPAPVVQVPEPIPIPDYSAWYLRGDIGYAFNEDPDLSFAGVSLSRSEMDDTWSLGVGLGYNFQDNIRGDITLDYRFKTDLHGISPGTGTPRAAELSSTVTLANLYYDFRGRDHFSPYIGAGLGFTFNETNAQTGTIGGDDSFDLAAAAMAGISYRMDNQWLFDAGYRFLYLGEAQTGSSGAIGALSIDDIYSHELRIGFRYELN